MTRPPAFRSHHRRATTLFVAAELVLTLAVPFLAIAGYHTLMESRAGRFVEQPEANEPGWRAVVDPTPLTAVVELTGERLTGIALVAAHAGGDSGGGSVILVPGNLVVAGQPLDARPVPEAVAALGSALRLRISATETVDGDRWRAVLGDREYTVSNPDPVVDDGGAALLAVGDIAVGADNVEFFLGRPAPGADPATLVVRRSLFWAALLAAPPAGPDPLNSWLADVAGPSAQVVDLPWTSPGAGGGPEPDLARAEIVIREVVPVPAGAVPGDRTQVRVLDRTGTADLAMIAAKVAATGLEVVEIGNASEFDGGLTHLVVPAGIEDPGLIELATQTGAATVEDGESDGAPVVTLLVGSDFALQ